jgi:hypothetical protein
MEMNPQLKNLAGPLRDIASKTIFSPLVSGFADNNGDTLLQKEVIEQHQKWI